MQTVEASPMEVETEDSDNVYNVGMVMLNGGSSNLEQNLEKSSKESLDEWENIFVVSKLHQIEII